MNNIQAEKREMFGKKVKSLRVKGVIPAELYGHGSPNTHLTVVAKDFLKVFREAGESAIITLKIKEDEKHGQDVNVLIYDVSHNPITDEITHVDFYQVRMDEKLKTEVPIHFIGEASAVKEKQGVLVKAMQEIEVESLPANLPHSIEVDLSVISELGQSIYVRDLKNIAGVKFLVDPETVIVTVTEPVKEEEVVKGPVSVEEVKVETTEKKEVREEKSENKEKK